MEEDAVEEDEEDVDPEDNHHYETPIPVAENDYVGQSLEIPPSTRNPSIIPLSCQKVTIELESKGYGTIGPALKMS
jgi:hypothetical protein